MVLDSSCKTEVIVLDGDIRPLVEYDIDSPDGTSTIAGIDVVESHPVRIYIKTTDVIGKEHFNYVHISIQDELYQFRDVYVNEWEQTVGDVYGEMYMSANELTVRTMYHKT